jgi:hypothetical protein
LKESYGEAIARQLVQKHKILHEEEFAYVTEKVAFNMREVLRKCRKNYWGVFDNPTDPNTGRDKVWFHLTKQFVDFVVKNIDLDAKDIKFIAKHDKAIGLTTLVRAIMRNKLDEARFGEVLDLLLRKLAIDGTVVVNTDLDSEQRLEFQVIDLLNFYIDPHAESIALTDAVAERIVLPKSEFTRLAKRNNWKNQDIEGVLNQDKVAGSPRQTILKEVVLFRYRGLAPKSILSNEEKDTENSSFEIICSETSGSWLFHHATPRKDNKDKGYEEGWYTRVHGRWYGEGVAERLLQYQIAYNANANIRLNRNYLTQLGLWVFRKGSGVTPQMLSRLAANGVIPVGDVDRDIKQLPVQDASPSSYKDAEVIYGEAQRSTGAFDSVAGDSMPASTTATNGAIQAQSAQTGFTLVREGFGMFIERLIQNRAKPLALSTIKVGDLIRMHCDEKQLQEIDEMVVHRELYTQMEQINRAGFVLDPMQVEMERQRALQSLRQQGKQRFVELLQNVEALDYDTDVTITTEDFNTPVMVSNINTLIQSLGALGLMEPVIELARQATDLMGLDATRIKMPQAPAPVGNNASNSMNPAARPGGNIAGAPAQGLNELATAARTMEPS